MAGFVRQKQRYNCKDCNYFFTISDDTSRRNTPRRTTMQDISKVLEVSISTVSRALRGHPDVSHYTQSRVKEKVAELLTKTVNSPFSHIQNNRRSIGLLVPTISGNYFQKIVTSVNRVLEQYGFNLLIMYSNESYRLEVSNINSMLESRVDGLLICISNETNNLDHLTILERKGFPMIFFTNYSTKLLSPKVLLNNYKGAFMAVEHLVLNGFKRIAYLGGPTFLSSNSDMLSGYLAAMKKFQVPIFGEFIISNITSQHEARIYGKSLLESSESPDAIIIHNESTALEIVKIAIEIGIAIPEHLALVTFGSDTPLRIERLSMTTIAVPVEIIGVMMTNLILKILGDKAQNYDKEEILEPRLILGNSSVIFG